MKNKKAKCVTCGEEIGHNGSAQKYCSRGCYTKEGSANPFYGKSHHPDTIARMKQRLSVVMAGENNPFYGRTHTPEAVAKIVAANRSYRENNKEEILSRQLHRLGLTSEKLDFIYDEYSQSSMNGQQMQEKYGVDKRVLYKYMVLLGACSEGQLAEAKFNKKYKNTNSAPEQKTYELLSVKYGEENVVRNYSLGSYYYDFMLFGKVLVEYDGFYWHNEVRNNDQRKTALAKLKGLTLYRIREPESRKTDFIAEMKELDKVVKNEI